jgi:hypothetical protein
VIRVRESRPSQNPAATAHYLQLVDARDSAEPMKVLFLGPQVRVDGLHDFTPSAALFSAIGVPC